MKKILFLIFFAAATMVTKVHAQSCHSTEPMAAFAKDENFRAQHPTPPPYQYTGPGEMISFGTPDGKEGKAFFIKAAKPTKNYLFVFHEWWGLNDWIKQMAAQLQKDLGDVNVLALDLYDGKLTTDQEEAGKLMGALDANRAEAIVRGALKHVGKDARILTIGWCLGGGWSLQATLISEEQSAGCVMYYGMPEKSIAKLKTLKSDVLFIFATKDGWINQDVVKEFETNMKTANKKLEVLSFDAVHAFANPSNPQHDKEAAAKAYQASFEFLKARL